MLRKLIEKCAWECLIIFAKAKNLIDDDGYIDGVEIWFKYPKFTKIMQWAGVMGKDEDYRLLLELTSYPVESID